MLVLISLLAVALQTQPPPGAQPANTSASTVPTAADSAARDSTRRDRRRGDEGRRIPVTAEHLASAYRDATARTLVERARTARMEQDSSLRSYDASAYRRISAGMSLRQTGRGRLLYRSEGAARMRWDRARGMVIDVIGARSVAPMFKGTELEVDLNDEVPGAGSVSIPYFPGREALWLPAFGGNGPVAVAQVDDRALVHPIAQGAEAYYTYRTGDSIAIRLADGRTVRLREIRVESRRPRWNAIVGSFWFDIATGHLARAAYRPSVSMDIWEVATETDGEDPRKEVPAWVLPMISPMEANVSAITIEYGLHEGRFWLPRRHTADGKARIGMMHVPVSVVETYRYASVNGNALDSVPRVEATVTAGARHRQQRCEEGSTRVITSRRYEGTVPVTTRIPCDAVLLTTSPDLPPSIYDEGEEMLGRAQLDEMLQSLSIDLQPGWSPRPPEIIWARERGQVRYNRIEGLSAGVGVRQVLGRGYTAEALARLGHADLQPGAELMLERRHGEQTIRYGAYRRLEAANDWGAPLGFGASLSALLFGRDEGFYYRATGAEVIAEGERGSLLTLRLFAEDQRDVDVETQFSLANAINGVRFIDNIEARKGALVGASLRSRSSRGLDPRGFRVHSDLRVEVGQGREGHGRGAWDLTLARGLGRNVAAAVTGSVGSSLGHLPVQRQWFLGGSQTVRGQRTGAATGNAYWMGRAELGTLFVFARPTIFYDAGWAGDRSDWRNPGEPLSGAGAGLSLLDGLVRFDLSRGIAPRQSTTFYMYVEGRF